MEHERRLTAEQKEAHYVNTFDSQILLSHEIDQLGIQRIWGSTGAARSTSVLSSLLTTSIILSERVEPFSGRVIK